ncbi:MarR family winged helix-turn-helix transcriptional regulator [Shewanella cyperi]|uniref:MarR family winged helix-turn-helix transcriptional regulator n=1 Tax=Shewanella cyperi TaxID=2814292 RepID=UPI001A9517B7|nr:MarR family transcriptional regulator [Shewanella cyperi]QSX42478.1 MarR family transcriptional regulator [Shewanella cyperi]
MANTTELHYQLLDFYEKFSGWEHDTVGESGLPLSWVHTIEMLGVHGPRRMTDLAKLNHVTLGTLTSRIDKLEALGLVERQANPEDRRSLLIALTEAGRAVFDEHDRKHRALTAALMAKLSQKERLQFADLLARVSAAFAEVDGSNPETN